MKKRILTKWLLVTIIIFSGILLTMYSRALSQVPSTEGSPVSLRYRAGLTGNYVGYAGPSTSPTYTNLSQITHLSTHIITGTALSNRCTLSPNESFITIDYQVRVNSVLKGDLSVGNTITVKLPGGKVAFKQPDGAVTYAEIRTPWFKKMENGKQYYLFLAGSKYSFSDPSLFPDVENTFYPTGGPQGVFEIVNGVVKSNSGRLRDPAWQYHNLTVTTFEDKIRITKDETYPTVEISTGSQTSNP